MLIVHWSMCVCVCVYSLPPDPSASPGKMKTPPVVVWWCRWSDPATPALGAFGRRREARRLDDAQTQFMMIITNNHTGRVSWDMCCMRLYYRNKRQVREFDTQQVAIFPLMNIIAMGI